MLVHTLTKWITVPHSSSQDESLVYTHPHKMNHCSTRILTEWITVPHSSSQSKSLFHTHSHRMNHCSTLILTEWKTVPIVPRSSSQDEPMFVRTLTRWITVTHLSSQNESLLRTHPHRMNHCSTLLLTEWITVPHSSSQNESLSHAHPHRMNHCSTLTLRWWTIV